MVLNNGVGLVEISKIFSVEERVVNTVVLLMLENLWCRIDFEQNPLTAHIMLVISKPSDIIMKSTPLNSLCKLTWDQPIVSFLSSRLLIISLFVHIIYISAGSKVDQLKNKAHGKIANFDKNHVGSPKLGLYGARLGNINNITIFVVIFDQRCDIVWILCLLYAAAERQHTSHDIAEGNTTNTANPI